MTRHKFLAGATFHIYRRYPTRLRSLQIFALVLQVNNFSSRKISIGRINMNVMYKMCISSTISTRFCHEIYLYWNTPPYMQSESRHWRSLLILGAVYWVIKRRTDVNNMHENVKLNKFLRANGWYSNPDPNFATRCSFNCVYNGGRQEFHTGTTRIE